MKHLARMQKSDVVVHTIPTPDAIKLIEAGLVRSVVVRPAPAEGQTAVNLTTKGQTWKPSKVITEPENTDIITEPENTDAG